MEPQAVQQSRTPSYPTRREVLAGAATFAAASLCGRLCVFAATNEGKTIVAPIFEHGEGRGATGCVVVSPPVFLSEEEAMQIVREELAKHGVQLKAGAALKDVRIPVRRESYQPIDKGNGVKEYEKTITEDVTRAKPLVVDGIDSDKKVAVEFVSEKDCVDLAGQTGPGLAQKYDLKYAAKYIAAQVKKQAKESVYVGFFYDPAVKWRHSEAPPREKKRDGEKRWKKDMEASKTEAKYLLRQQVQDFAAWLKEKKAIQDSSK
jgi:hypothetical protein